MRHLSGLGSFANSWADWKSVIQVKIGASPTPESIFDLGDVLSEIFRSRIVTGRDNAAVSQGGIAWECLVCWYLNLIFWGTDVIVIRPHASFLPEQIKNALSVNIQNTTTNTESDLVVFSIPNVTSMFSLNLGTINELLKSDSANMDVTVVQCKTNWNDNSQIPMLWDLIYNSGSFRVPNVSVGREGVSPASFRRFSYAFVTVPTSRGSFLPNGLPVLRVRGLTGGNYWGHATTVGVARSIKEFFTTNFGTHFSGTVHEHIEANLISNDQIIQKFVELDFSII